eukprot:403359085
MESSASQNTYVFPLKKDHEEIMVKNGLNIEKIQALRRDIHSFPEVAFNEVETSRKIKEHLISFEIEESAIKQCAQTGWVVDIKGTAAPQEKSEDTIEMIALRADIDALPIPENNPHLEYKSQTACAHMCGHDGHIATLVAAAQVLAANRDNIPSNKTVRLLFQPAEEMPGGAIPMIKEGCLEGVDEVYGFHNVPNFEEGDVRVKAGAIMAASNKLEIRLKGVGGHGSSPHLCQDVISAGAALIANLHTIKSRSIDSKENFILSITQFHSGHTYNVFPDHAFLQGSIRTYNDDLMAKIIEKIRHISAKSAEAYDCVAEVTLIPGYAAVINHEKQVDIFKRVATKYFGEDKVNEKDLPLTASEDFSYFLHQKPGCFFMLGTKKAGEPTKVLHTSTYDYNDSVIGSGAYLYVRLVEDRFGVKILKE